MKHKFKVGDRVQFKSWEELKKEFGVTVLGDIPTSPYYFTEQMKHLCDTQAVIRVLNDREVMLDRFDVADGNRVVFAYCIDMLKPIKLSKSKVKPDKNDDLVDTLSYMKKHIKQLEPRYSSVVTTIDDVEWSDEEQIKWHEECLKELKKKQLEKKWNFTEDEKVILRNLPEEYSWIGRDNLSGRIYIFVDKPHKEDGKWTNDKAFNYLELRPFQHLFQCIQWTDTESCEFRKYI